MRPIHYIVIFFSHMGCNALLAWLLGWLIGTAFWPMLITITIVDAIWMLIVFNPRAMRRRRKARQLYFDIISGRSVRTHE